MHRQIGWFSIVILIMLGSILQLDAVQYSRLATASAPTTNLDLTTLQNIKQIAAGSYHTCALTTNGGVVCWGNNDYGQLGDNTNTGHNLPGAVFGLSSGVKAIVAGAYHTCALTNAGSVKCWGNNEFGQLGDGTKLHRLIPTDVLGLGGDVLALALGDYHTCARLANAVKCWGANDHGQLGDTTQTLHGTPATVNGLANGVSALGAGGNHTCAIVAGGIQCWGDNTDGQLGDGSTTDRLAPTQVSGLTSGVSALALGQTHTCAVVNGGAKCWGLNSDGQLGDGSETDTLTAVNVFNLGSGVTALTAGEKHTCALLSSGGLKCWGRNAYGQVGDPALNYITMPVDVTGLTSGVVEVTAGSKHTCARLNGDTVKCWGLGEGGQLGDGGEYRHSTPAAVIGLNDGIQALAAGKYHSCALVNGAAKCWGANDYLQLGNSTAGASPIPVDVAIAGNTLTALNAGGQHACALTNGGGLKCWGGNYWGQLGGGDTNYTDQIIDVIGLASGVITFTTGDDHTCALVASGAKCWGHNNYGQLGNGEASDQSVPVNVVGAPNGALVALAGGGYHTCALTQRGGVQCWGNNFAGQLGIGSTTISATRPVSVTGLVTGVVQVVTGANHSCALLVSGGAKCWGANDLGQLGDNTNHDRDTPTDVFGLNSGVKKLAAGSNYTCALLNTGEIRCWGQNADGQLGDATLIERKVPVTTGLSGTATLLATGANHACAVLAQGGVRCWGQGADGRLGNGQVAWRYTPADVLTPGTTATPTLTATPTATSNNGTPETPTPTATTLPAAGDAYENDNACAQAHPISSDGTMQLHNFYAVADTDWVQFAATANKRYLVEVNIPPNSPADVALELYSACGGLSTGGQNYSFSPGIRFEFSATTTSPIFLKLQNNDPAVAGAQVGYELSVRALDQTSTPGSLILVAGSIKANDPVQANIYNVTDAVYQLFIDQGYTDDRIYYLAPSREHSQRVDATSTRDNLQAAITTWANSRVGADQALTLYLMDHGAADLFYLDKARNEWVTPDDIDQWLSQLETAHAGLKVNIIIEACYSGSFITEPQSISRAGRVVITSTDAKNLAWASDSGARFSDHFLTALRRGQSLYASYRTAQIAVKIANAAQTAWLDGDGDKNPLDDGEHSAAAQRGFTFAGTFPDDLWPPYIAQVEPPPQISAGRGLIRAQVRDDVKVAHVWAVIYPPSYTPPSDGEALVQEALSTVTLLAQGNDAYAAYYDGFDQAGVYHVVVYADDNQASAAQPVAIAVTTGGQVFVPVIKR